MLTLCIGCKNNIFCTDNLEITDYLYKNCCLYYDSYLKGKSKQSREKRALLFFFLMRCSKIVNGSFILKNIKLNHYEN